MMIDTGTDNHVHTKLCRHATGEMEEYVLAAIDRGLDKIIFLEHLEAGISYFERTWLNEEDFTYYFEEGERLRTKYRDRLEIGLGVEVGYNPDFVDEIRQHLSLHDWDLIGISYHFLETASGHLNLVSRRQSNIEAFGRIGVSRIMEQYLQDLREAVENLPGHVLCHVDAVLRHHPDAGLKEEHDDLLDKLFGSMAARNMALEINTAGYRIRGEPYPLPRIIRKATQLNIPLVAGSDAHRPEDVGRYFDRLPDLLEEIKDRPLE